MTSDGYLRYKAVRALGRLRREHPDLVIPGTAIEPHVVSETNRYFNYLSLHYNLVHKDPSRKTRCSPARCRKSCAAPSIGCTGCWQ